MMREQEMALAAAHKFGEVVQQLDDTKWDDTLPPEFKTFDKKPVTVREIINYHAYDDAWIPDMLAGRTMQEVGDDNWKGDLLGEAPKSAYAQLNSAACAAIEALDDPERTVHCSFGDFSARDYLLQVISFRGLRAYDLSKALDMSTELPEELVQGMWDLLVPHADEWRQWGVYEPAIAVPESAPLQQRLLNTLGYQ